MKGTTEGDEVGVLVEDCENDAGLGGEHGLCGQVFGTELMQSHEVCERLVT